MKNDEFRWEPDGEGGSFADNAYEKKLVPVSDTSRNNPSAESFATNPSSQAASFDMASQAR